MSDPGWSEVTEALERLRRLLAPRIGPTATEGVVRQIWRMREGAGATSLAVLEVVHRTLDAYGRTRPSGSPFSLAQSRALVEAAPRKLQALHFRLQYARPPRGLDRPEAEAIASHADALCAAYGADDAEFAAAVAYLNALHYRHHLVFGEVFNRNDPEPAFALWEAAVRRDFGADHVPISLVREHGLLYALGPVPTPSLGEPWTPHGFLFSPLARGRPLRLDDRADLATFLERVAPPITPETLAALLFVLLAPFPWTATVRFDDAALLARFTELEPQLEDWRWQNGRGGPALPSSALLGLPRQPPLETREEISFVVEPAGVPVRYRAAPPSLHIG